ncbi:MAG: hypothetical protein F6K40_30560 [Okeania sp. SIO3I5]|nr:hypothetical protein [Okeania sp. SIO3I5]NEQ40342.1 hypothetical protein [Okeania sp. SIO3I5]
MRLCSYFINVINIYLAGEISRVCGKKQSVGGVGSVGSVGRVGRERK